MSDYPLVSSNMACWNMDHWSVISLLKPPFSSRIFHCHVWLPKGTGYFLDVAKETVPKLSKIASIFSDSSPQVHRILGVFCWDCSMIPNPRAEIPGVHTSWIFLVAPLYSFVKLCQFYSSSNISHFLKVRMKIQLYSVLAIQPHNYETSSFLMGRYTISMVMASIAVLVITRG